MNCDELRDHYDLYALGMAEQPERDEIRAHLNRGCAVCTAGVKRSLATTALLASTVPMVQPSADLRRQIVASVGVPERRHGWMPVWATALAIAALCAVAVYLAVKSDQYAQTAARLREELRSETGRLARLTDAFAILSGPRTTEVSFGSARPKPPEGKVFLNPTRGVLLIASNLPQTSADKIYEMWIMPKGAKPVPAGLFQSQEDGSAMHMHQGAVNVAGTEAVAVTVEDRAGAPQPTTQPLILAPLASPK